MEKTITTVFLTALLMFLVGYWLQKSRLKKLERKVMEAEDAMLRTDKDYLAVIKENEALKEEILKNKDEEITIITLQELLKNKSN